MNQTVILLLNIVASHTSRFLFQLSKCIVVLVFLQLNVSSHAQIKAITVAKNEIPASVVYKGNYYDAYKWNDADGEHLLLRTKTGETTSRGHDKEESFFDAALYVFHFIVQKDSLQLTWKVQDYVKECELDLTADFIKNSFAITDLDKNNKAEIWLMYKLACRGDVSPALQKIIMYEGSKKYAVRGATKVPVNDKEYIGGEMTFDESFKSASTSFKEYASKLWDKYELETFQ